MIASEASARSTSLSVMPPTAACSSRTLTSLESSSVRSCLEHVDGALHVGLEDDAEFLDRALLDGVVEVFQRDLVALGDFALAVGLLAFFGDFAGLVGVFHGVELVAGAGNRRPGRSTSTGEEGPASWICLPLSSVMERTRPQAGPQTRVSPTCSVPFCTSTRATTPRLGSMKASMTAPRPGAQAMALSSLQGGGVVEILDEFLDALAGDGAGRTTSVSPPHSAGFRPCSASWPRTLLGLASGLSILFMATTIGTPAALAWLIDSMVCGMTPSSAATTSTTTSVMLAPRARMAVKAWWPGVSRNVTRLILPSPPVISTV